jgi:cell division protein FtsI/penicillin-binding protein 2
MKRRIVLIVVFVLVFLGLIIGVLYLNNASLFSSSNKEDRSSQTTTIQYPVTEGEVTHTYELNAQVVSGQPDLYMVDITLENVSAENFGMLKEKGSVVTPGEPFYKYKGAEKSVQFNGLIADILPGYTDGVHTTTIKLLNYDSLYVLANVDVSQYQKINYSTEVKVIYNDQEYQSKIITIGCEIADKKLPVEIALPDKILPGSEVKVIFVLGIEEHGLFVSEDALYQDGDKYYANVLDDSGSSWYQTQVTIGQRFSQVENGLEFKYVELLSGVGKDDILVVEKSGESSSSIEQSLLSE